MTYERTLMKTITTGAHLHFEARISQNVARGLTGRIDPVPFLDTKLKY